MGCLTFLLAVGTVVFLAVVNRYAPNRRESKWRWVSIGSVLATIFWLGASALFSFYVSNFGNYNQMYGSLSTPIVLMTWLYLSSFLLLVGATVNAETEHQTTRDSTVGRDQPMGERQLDCAKTLAEGNCAAGEKFVTGYNCQGDPFINASGAMSRIGDFGVRLKCGLNPRQDDLFVETVRVDQTGNYAINPISKQTETWQDPAGGIPFACAVGASSTAPITNEDVNVLLLHDDTAFGFSSPGSDSDSVVIYDRCFRDSRGRLTTKYSQGQREDHFITWPANIQNHKIPIFEGEVIRLLHRWAPSQGYDKGTRFNSTDFTLYFKDWTNRTIWTLYIKLDGSNRIASSSIIPAGFVTVSPNTYAIPVDQDGYLVFKPGETLFQYTALFVQHVLNQSGSISPPPPGVSMCGVSQERIDFIASKMPLCADKVRSAMEGTTQWRN